MLDLTLSNLMNQDISWEKGNAAQLTPGFTHVKEYGNINPEPKAVLTTVISFLLGF